MSNEVIAYYRDAFDEESRLTVDPDAAETLELARSKEIIVRHLSRPPATVLDVGGGPGVYAQWLTAGGYEVHLVDRHVEQALDTGRGSIERIASATVGDARAPDREDSSCDAVLLMGPIYHLTEPEDRLEALSEARRVLRPGGRLLFVTAINRLVYLLHGLVNGLLDDPEFVKIVQRGLTTGVHHNHVDDRRYFTTAYMHAPVGLEGEIVEAGFSVVETVALQGPQAGSLVTLRRAGPTLKRGRR